MVRWMLIQPQNSKFLNCFEIENSEIKLDPPSQSILCPNCKNFLNWGLAGPLPPLIGTMSLNLQVFFLDGIPNKISTQDPILPLIGQLIL